MPVPHTAAAQDWVPPKDLAHDILLVRQSSDEDPFMAIEMEHKLPGCGFLAQNFGDGGKAMVLGQGEMGKPGYQLLLEWPSTTG